MVQSLLTKESLEIRQFFRNIDTLSRLLDIQAEKFRPLLNGDRYMTDSELAGKLKLTRRTLADYRLNGKIIVQGERCPGIAGGQPDGSVRLNPVLRLPTGRFFFSMTNRHSYRISILTCKGSLLPSIGQGGPPDWLEGKNHPRFAPVFFPPKPCAITAKSKPGHIRNGNTGLAKAGHV